jgi:hypothetical protein
MSVTSVAGDSQKITVTVYLDEALLNLTPYSVTFRALRDDGTLITKTLGDGVVLLAQSGATLGQMEITILPADYPASWLATPYGTHLKVPYEVEIVNGTTRYTPVQDTWIVTGQMIA